ncbi:MAG: hypothetical protein CBE43_07715 [Rhodopirellula sp. TMED283]|nr:MAG: hypothetical protein CBE43_07715 [Rhodopirellula sp. TMED283]
MGHGQPTLADSVFDGQMLCPDINTASMKCGSPESSVDPNLQKLWEARALLSYLRLSDSLEGTSLRVF